MFRSLLALVVLAATVSAQKKPTFNVSSLPDKWEAGQIGTNQCKKYGASNQKSMCQNVFLNSADDFCLWAPVKKGTVGDQEEKMISWCTKSGYGTRLIPNGTLKGVHFVRTPDFIQITGQGDFTSMNIVRGDAGGELDPHGATGAGNPPGGIVYSRNVPGREGQWVQLKEWSNFMSATEFCFRACYPGKGNATKYCPHIYDVLGCGFNHPGNYGFNVFENCEGESGLFPGIYGTSTFYQGQKKTPAPHPAGKSSKCKRIAAPTNGPAANKPYRRSHPNARP